MRAAPQVGAEIPAYATAIGKVYLVFSPDEIAASERVQCTRATLVDAAAQARLAKTVRARGWAEMREKWLPGLACVAAPIHLRERVVGVLAITGPTSRFDSKRLAVFRTRVVEAASEIERRLAGRREVGERG